MRSRTAIWFEAKIQYKKTQEDGLQKIGQAQVVFGGAVQGKMGSVQGNEDAVAVGLSELKHSCPQSGIKPENDETFGVQVILVFPDLPTLTNFRDILDEVETSIKSRMKDGMEAP